MSAASCADMSSSDENELCEPLHLLPEGVRALHLRNLPAKYRSEALRKLGSGPCPSKAGFPTPQRPDARPPHRTESSDERNELKAEMHAVEARLQAETAKRHEVELEFMALQVKAAAQIQHQELSSASRAHVELTALQLRLDALHAAQLFTDDELYLLEDYIGVYVALKSTDDAPSEELKKRAARRNSRLRTTSSMSYRCSPVPFSA